MQEVNVPKEFIDPLHAMLDHIVDVLRLSTQYPAGPNMTVAAIMLLLIRAGHAQNPDIVDKLREAIDASWIQFRGEQI